MRKLEVDTQYLQRDNENLEEALKEMENAREEMMAEFRTLNDMWEGEAKNAFTTQFESDYKTLCSMDEILNKLLEDWKHAKDRYEKCEKDIASIVSSM